MNYFGTLSNNSSPNQGGSFGYPQCYSAWDVSSIPNNTDIQGGTQFAIGYPNATNNDVLCREKVAPRLVFQAHMAPLAILFNNAGTEAWITYHGNWDRTNPVVSFTSAFPQRTNMFSVWDTDVRAMPQGCKISVVQFAIGEPVANSTSMTAAVDVVANQDNSQCPGKCFRPVGLAWDSRGRLFFSSDATGEIYVVSRATSSTTSTSGSTSTSSKTSTSSRTTTSSRTSTSSSTGSLSSTTQSGTTTFNPSSATPTTSSAERQFSRCWKDHAALCTSGVLS